MKATRPARLLAATVEFVDAYWGIIGLAVVVALEVLVFGPRQQHVGMILAGAAGAAMLVTWMGGGSGWRPR